jgi:NADPH2:quinone reductase
MHAAVLRSLGAVPSFEEFAEPVPADGEVLVHVRGAALKPVDRAIAAGTHYMSPRALPAVVGIDGVGHLDDGTRVLFVRPRPPFGAMAERAVVNQAQCWPVPAGVDDVHAAALFNPGISAWMSLSWRARLAPGETVLVLGATGTTGKLAVQLAKRLGARRVVAAGRNRQVLEQLPGLGADALIHLDTPRDELIEALIRGAGGAGYDVILDYLWGAPTEALLAALPRLEPAGEVRLVQVGESAGATISLPGSVLRSAALTIVGNPGRSAPREVTAEAVQKLMAYAGRGELRVEAEEVRLRDVAAAWRQQDPGGRRVVLVP